MLDSVRRSSNGQDTTPSSVETAVQIRPRRSIVRSLVVEEVAPSVIAPMMLEHHYLRCMPIAPVGCFGVSLDDELVGGVLLTTGARNGHRFLVGARPEDVATLARLYLADEIPKNAESRVLGIVTRLLRQKSSFRALVSYADPAAGHAGTIYRAAGWSYLGLGQATRYLDFGDGVLRHPRTVSSNYGTNTPMGLRRQGIKARAVVVGGKHRFCYLLDPSWSWRVQPSENAAA